MLELLASDLGIRDRSMSCIEATYFVRALAQAYANPEVYRTARRFGWLRRLGTSFSTKDRNHFGSIANQNENHWVALAIDCEKKHLGMEFKWTGIPVAKQTDPHSCGILAYFTLAHWFDSERFPLPNCTAASMAEERIKMFLRVVERQGRKVGDLASDAWDYEFTFAQSLGLSEKSGVQDGNEDDGENE
ncbi:ULP-PROTEASE domain-containing protein [Mycena venus]|uniref:ULP-PROTEASE domain-containing protein n=1 Tax=Mycena venus TaxID=2733690 RepID=A0A8H6Z3Z7_9AGAR|nr:ULP-PROTEASE domain-containing protein [Mycena venus]